MTVVAGRNGEVVAWVGDGTRDLVAATLEAHLAAVTDSLACELVGEERERQQRYLTEVTALRRQLERTTGPVVLSGSTPLVVEIVRDTAIQATHDLDTAVEEIAATPSRLSEEAIEGLRARTQVATACIEALIACESSRGEA